MLSTKLLCFSVLLAILQYRFAFSMNPQHPPPDYNKDEDDEESSEEGDEDEGVKYHGQPAPHGTVPPPQHFPAGPGSASGHYNAPGQPWPGQGGASGNYNAHAQPLQGQGSASGHLNSHQYVPPPQHFPAGPGSASGHYNAPGQPWPGQGGASGHYVNAPGQPWLGQGSASGNYNAHAQPLQGQGSAIGHLNPHQYVPTAQQQFWQDPATGAFYPYPQPTGPGGYSPHQPIAQLSKTASRLSLQQQVSSRTLSKKSSDLQTGFLLSIQKAKDDVIKEDPNAPSKYDNKYSFFYQNNEFVTYPVSEAQYGYGIVPAIMEASLWVDLNRTWLNFDKINQLKGQKKLQFADNSKFEFDYNVAIQEGFLNSETFQFDAEDKWAKKICDEQKTWIEDIQENRTKQATAHLEQLVGFSMLGRKMLWYISLFNATFGMPNTDIADVNEIMVSMTRMERESLGEMYKKHGKIPEKTAQQLTTSDLKVKQLCNDLVQRENAIKKKVHYSVLMEALCLTNRDEIFMEKKIEEKEDNDEDEDDDDDDDDNDDNDDDDEEIKATKEFEDLKQDAELLREFFAKFSKEFTDKKLENFKRDFWNAKRSSGLTKGKTIIKLLTQYNYERLRFVLEYHKVFFNNGIMDQLKLAKANAAQIKDTDTKDDAQALLNLVEMIIIDVLYGRPYLFALILRDKLETLYKLSDPKNPSNKNFFASADKKKKKITDAFNDISRIFFLRGPIDLADVYNVYGDANVNYLSKSTETGQPLLHNKAKVSSTTQKTSSKKKAVQTPETNLLDEDLTILSTTLKDSGKIDGVYTISGYQTILIWLTTLSDINIKKKKKIKVEQAFKIKIQYDLKKYMDSVTTKHIANGPSDIGSELVIVRQKGKDEYSIGTLLDIELYKEYEANAKQAQAQDGGWPPSYYGGQQYPGGPPHPSQHYAPPQQPYHVAHNVPPQQPYNDGRNVPMQQPYYGGLSQPNPNFPPQPNQGGATVVKKASKKKTRT